jgi:hypothetical protein
MLVVAMGVVMLASVGWCSGAVATAAASAGGGKGSPAHFRTLPPPKVLYLADSPDRQQLAEMLAAKMPAEMTFAPLEYRDTEDHHLCDKPLEESKPDTAYVRQQGAKYVADLLADLKRFDVVIAQIQPRPGKAGAAVRSEGAQERLAEYVRAGGKLIFINPSWETAFGGTALAEVLPVKAGKGKAWTPTCLGATDHPLVRGLPLATLGTHWYGPVYEPADETCLPLTKNPAGKLARFWYRKLPGEAGGQTVHLFQAYGQRYEWSGTSYDQYDPQRPDDSAAWDALFQRLIYGLAYGEKAFPVLTEIQLPADLTACRFGDKLAVGVSVENRTTADRKVAVCLAVSTRRGPRTASARAETALKAGQQTTVPLEVLVDLPCTDKFVRVRAWVEDAAGAGTGTAPTPAPAPAVLSESVAWLPYTHQLPVVVRTDRPAYRPGEPIEATLAWAASGQLGDYVAVIYLVDRTGRALAAAEGLGNGDRHPPRREPVPISKAGTWSARLTMPDGGPEALSSYWIAAVVRRAGPGAAAVAGTAWAQVQLDQPWDMRRQFHWSVWSSGGDGQYMAMFRDAGFNAFGCSGNCALADRFGMRQYVEGCGVNTFGVKIDKPTWADVRKGMEAEFDKLNKTAPDSRSKAIVSLGEESGFGGGWGARYYWPDPNCAPPVAQKAFGEYLAEAYKGDIAALNAEWGTEKGDRHQGGGQLAALEPVPAGQAYKAFADVLLEKDRVRSPGQVFVAAEAWEAMSRKKEQAPIQPAELVKVDPARKYLANSAPYYETYRFFDWYYQKYCDVATELYHARRNAVPRTIMSAPAGLYPKVDVYGFNGLGPFYPKETGLAANAVARRDYGDVPGVSCCNWAYFDLRSLWESTVLSCILVGNCHVGFWVDVPLTINPDLTHTRATFWTKLLTARCRPIEPVLLHKRVAYTEGLGMFVGDQPMPHGLAGKHFASGIHCNAPLYSAMEESGYLPRVVGAAGKGGAGAGAAADDLDGIRVLVASHAQVVSAEQGARIARFVREGGVLISTPWLASCSPHGNMLSVYPAEETHLADVLGFKLLNTSQALRKQDVTVDLGGKLPGLPTPLTLTSKGSDGVRDLSGDVEVLAKYADGTPLLLRRTVGRGKVIHLNMLYDWDGWWNSFHEPARESFRKLVAALIATEGKLPAEYSVAFESARSVDDAKGWWGVQMKSIPQAGESVPWWASQLYADPGGQVRYLAVFAEHRAPEITAAVRWARPGVRAFDLFTGAEVPVAGGAAKLTLRPGQAAFWAMVSQVPTKLTVSAPPQVAAGQPVPVTIRLPELAGSKAVHGLVVEVTDPSGAASSFHTLRNVNVAGGAAELAIPTAVNDTPGTYRIVATESITRLRAEASFVLQAPAAAGPASADRELLNPFPPRASDDRWPVGAMTDAQFLDALRALRAVYQGTHQGLEAKYMLSYYLNVPFRPGNRHALVRRLQRTPWAPHAVALADALRAGETFYLVGEDVNVDPASGTRIDPLAVADIPACLKQLAELPGATRRRVTAEGMDFDVIRLGRGAIVTAVAGVDQAVYLSADFAAWHARLKKAMAAVATEK